MLVLKRANTRAKLGYEFNRTRNSATQNFVGCDALAARRLQAALTQQTGYKNSPWPMAETPICSLSQLTYSFVLCSLKFLFMFCIAMSIVFCDVFFISWNMIYAPLLSQLSHFDCPVTN
jgi:hypothetical protein